MGTRANFSDPSLYTKKNTMPPVKKTNKGTATGPNTFYIDYSIPANDKIFDAAAFEKFMQDRIKVDGRAGQLGDKIKLSRESSGKLAISSNVPISKRYLKYLTKKYLKKNAMREWLRVVATDKNTYQLKFFNIEDEEEAVSDAE